MIGPETHFAGYSEPQRLAIDQMRRRWGQVRVEARGLVAVITGLTVSRQTGRSLERETRRVDRRGRVLR